jgi:dienelactone hydrolase
MLQLWSWLLIGFVWCGSQTPALTAKPIPYRDGGATLEGWLTLPPAARSAAPGILLLHEDGPASPAARKQAAAWATLGYGVFAADCHGKDPSAKAPADAAAWLKNRSAVKSRIDAAVDAFKRQPGIDPRKLAVVGYGVGATAALEYARTGADLAGIVAVHGEPTLASAEVAKKIRTELLLIWGAEDPAASPAAIAKLEAELSQGGVDWQCLRLGGVAGGFTNPRSGRNLRDGRAHDPAAVDRVEAIIKGHLEYLFSEDSPPAAPPEKAADTPKPPPNKPRVQADIPEKALAVLKHIDQNGEAPAGYEGGRRFGNFERLLPNTDRAGRRINYREWDVNPLRPGVNRGAERLVTGSDGSAYYTDDHYRSFKKIR